MEEIFFASSFASKIILLLRLETNASFSSAEMASKISRFFSLVSIVSSFLDDAMRRNTASFFVVVVNVVVVVFDAPSSASTTVLALFLRAEDDDKDKDDESPTPRTPNLCVFPNDFGLVQKRERRTPTKVAFASTR